MTVSPRIPVHNPRAFSALSELLGGIALIAFPFTIISLIERGVRPETLILVGVNLVPLVLAGLVELVRRRVRETISLTPRGFVHHSRLGDREFHDSEVVSIRTGTEFRYLNGVIADTWTRYDLALADRVHLGETRHLLLFAVASEPRAGELTALMERIEEQLAARGRERLRQGGEIDSADWKLSSERLAIPSHKPPITIPLSQLSHVERVRGELRLWTFGDPKPVAALSEGTENLTVLEQLLREDLDEFPPPPAEADDVGLGRLLFERTAGRPTKLILQVTVFTGLVSIFLKLCGLVANLPGLMASGLALSILGTIVWGICKCFDVTFRCYERGVSMTAWSKTIFVTYDQLRAVSWTLRRQASGARAPDFQLTIALGSLDSPQAHELTYWRMMKGFDFELLNVRDTIHRHLIPRMRREYDSFGNVRWTDRLTLTREGLEWRRRRWLFFKQRVVIPYEEITGVSLNLCKMYLRRAGSVRPFVHDTSAPNFHAGLEILGQLLHETSGRPLPETPFSPLLLEIANEGYFLSRRLQPIWERGVAAEPRAAAQREPVSPYAAERYELQPES